MLTTIIFFYEIFFFKQDSKLIVKSYPYACCVEIEHRLKIVGVNPKLLAKLRVAIFTDSLLLPPGTEYAVFSGLENQMASEILGPNFPGDATIAVPTMATIS